MDKNRIMRILLELCKVPSVSESEGERRMPEKLREILSRTDYFSKHPQNIRIHKIPGDPMDRSFVFALREADPGCARTIVLLSHFDVVDVDEFGAFRDYAFDPEGYTDFLRNSGSVELPEEAKADLESGDYLFGRGTMDMKFGIAAQIELLHHVDEAGEPFPVNLLFASVPDEEANSAGMLAAVEELLSLKKERQLEYLCCIVTEPYMSKYPGDTARYIYAGAEGKLMPAFYCVGKETHVGEPFEGLNPNLLTAYIIEQFEQNPDLADSIGGVYGPVPVCLKQADLKEAYSVQIPTAAYTYFNYMTLKLLPDELLEKMKEVAVKAFEKALSLTKARAARMEALTDIKLLLPELQPKIYTYEELYRLCLEKHGSAFEAHMKEFTANAAAGDLRELSVKAVREAHRFCPDRNPMIVLFFAPPFYPHTDLPGEDSLVMQVCREIAGISEKVYGEGLDVDPHFSGITDMCYLQLAKGLNIEALEKNMPLWGKGYSVPLAAIEELNMPFINVGPMGKDAHKFTERLNLSYSFNTAVELLKETVYLLCEKSGM